MPLFRVWAKGGVKRLYVTGDDGSGLGYAAPARPYRAPARVRAPRNRAIPNFRHKTAEFAEQTEWPEGVEVAADEWADTMYVSYLDPNGTSRATSAIHLDPRDDNSLDRDAILAEAREIAESDARKHYFTDEAKARAAILADLIARDQNS